MSGIDLTVAVTAHSESLVAGPTMTSAERAIALAEAEGMRVERLLGLDACTPQARAYFAQPGLAAWERHDFVFRDQGQTRNALAGRARGRWLAFLDGDDLFSENWLVEAARLLARAETEGARVIVHPELNWQFDAGASVILKPAQDDPLFSPYYFAVTNYYDALCAAPRQVWLDHPYAHRAVRDGFAYEDWQWGIETMAAGWHHVAARDTIIFKRRRDASQIHESKAHSSMIRPIEAIAIDRIAKLGGP